MRRTVLSTFLFVAILGLGCIGVAVPSKSDELKQKHWAGYKTKITDGSWDLTIRYSESGENYFALISSPSGNEARCEGAVDERGNLERVDCTPDVELENNYPDVENNNSRRRYLAGNVWRMVFGGSVVFIDTKIELLLLVRQDTIAEQPSVSDGADALEKIGNKCTALGFTKGTEKHGDCVMKLYK